MKKFVVLFLLLSLCSSGNEENIEEAEVEIETTTTIGVEMSDKVYDCLLYTSPSPRDLKLSRMPSSA